MFSRNWMTGCSLACPLAAITALINSSTLAAPTVPAGFRVELFAQLPVRPAQVIAVAPDYFGSYGGQVFVASSDTSVIHRVDSTGAVSVYANLPSPNLGGGITFGRGSGTPFGGDMYVNVHSSSSPQLYGPIYRITSSATVSLFGTASPASPLLVSGSGLTISPGGLFGDYLYTGTSTGDYVTRIPTSGGAATMFNNLGCLDGLPTGFAFGHGAAGFTTNLYFGVQHWTTGCGIAPGVYSLTSAGVRSALATNTQNALITSIKEIEFGPGGHFGADLYAADRAGRILRIDSTGNVTVFASGLTPWPGGGNSADGLAFDGRRALYFNEPAMGKIWRVTACQSDLHVDGHVDMDDLLVVINNWGLCPQPCPPSCMADITNDCTVDMDDLLEVVNGWGSCP